MRRRNLGPVTTRRALLPSHDHGPPPLNIVILGLTITSSWGNGHATTYRGLVRGLARRGHQVLFLEADRPWYADNRDLPEPPYGQTFLYKEAADLQAHAPAIRRADLVVVGSYVPDGIAAGSFVQATARGATAFYDIDTPVTLAAVEAGTCSYLTLALMRGYDLYLSFTGGPTLDTLERRFGVRAARPLYCSADPAVYRPDPAAPTRCDLGYLGTYGADRQPTLDRLLCEPARRWPAGRFAVAGPQYPATIGWPPNVRRTEHLAPDQHRGFYTSQLFTLNVTRADMVRLGWSPSVRLFEAACCGTPIVSDVWPGLDHFFQPGRDILTAATADDVLAHLRTPEPERRRVADAARARVLAAHTGDHRAAELEAYVSGKVPA